LSSLEDEKVAKRRREIAGEHVLVDLDDEEFY